MYLTTRVRMSSIMEPIGPELSELSALEFENLPYLTVYCLASANIEQSVPNLATIHMPMRARTSLIMGQIEPEHPELFALEFGKLLNLTLFTLFFLPDNLFFFCPVREGLIYFSIIY